MWRLRPVSTVLKSASIANTRRSTPVLRNHSLVSKQKRTLIIKFAKRHCTQESTINRKRFDLLTSVSQTIFHTTPVLGNEPGTKCLPLPNPVKSCLFYPRAKNVDAYDHCATINTIVEEVISKMSANKENRNPSNGECYIGADMIRKY